MTFYRRNLPHLLPDDSILFISFRLADSVPQYLIRKLRKEYSEKCKNFKSKNKKEYNNKINELRLKYFYMLDELIDKNANEVNYLAIEEIAKKVYTKIIQFDNIRYELLTMCIMPNHVHMVINNNIDFELNITNREGTTKDLKITDTLKLIKGSTSRYSNLILKKKGKFWNRESFDRLIRNQNELIRVINYVIKNPVKARLVKNWEDWQYTYLKDEIFGIKSSLLIL
jgi:putative transposase